MDVLGYVCSFCRRTFTGTCKRDTHKIALGHLSKSKSCRAAGAELFNVDIQFGAADVMAGGSGALAPPHSARPGARPGPGVSSSRSGMQIYYDVNAVLFHKKVFSMIKL